MSFGVLTQVTSRVVLVSQLPEVPRLECHLSHHFTFAELVGREAKQLVGNIGEIPVFKVCHRLYVGLPCSETGWTCLEGSRSGVRGLAVQVAKCG
jgi:hypothetical protein